MLLTGDIEHFGTGILEMIELSKEVDLPAPEFVINEGFIVILWRPSATAKAIHDTAHDTAHDTIHDTIHDTKFIAIENLSHRVVWLLDNEMSRNE